MDNEIKIVPYGSWYTLKRNGDEITITGYDPSQEIDVGFNIVLGDKKPLTYQIINIERRNHVGKFNDEANRVNSFYSATANLIKNEPRIN
jgi:hypothetical protein